MKKFIKKIAIVGLTVMFFVFGYLLVGNYAKKNVKSLGISTKAQIEFSFDSVSEDTYESYILGNSRVYRGMDPDYFTQHTYNFAHDNDSFNQMYYKLLYLYDINPDVETVILGMDYFQFSFLASTRNYIYRELFPNEYMQDFDTGFDEILDEVKERWFSGNRIPIKKLIAGDNSEPSFVMKANGQFLYPGTAKESDATNRSMEILDVHYMYFEKIIEFCQNNNIDYYIVMPPIRNAELECYQEEDMECFNNMIIAELGDESYRYLNYSEHSDFKDFTMYTDITHLNAESAKIYTAMVNDDIIQLKKLKHN